MTAHNRPLLPIEQYANREGISVEEAEQCAKIGIIQLRKHRGQTYVIDLPVCSYEATAEIDAEVAELINKTNENHTEKITERKAPNTTINKPRRSAYVQLSRNIYSSTGSFVHKFFNSVRTNFPKLGNNRQVKSTD